MIKLTQRYRARQGALITHHLSYALVAIALVACDDGGDTGLMPVGYSGDTAGDTAGSSTTAGMTTAGMTTAGMTTAGMTTAGMTTAGMTTAGMTTAGMTTAGTASAGAMTAGDEAGTTTVVPPMDDAGRCFEGCLALLQCHPNPLDTCGNVARSAFAATCQSACDTNTAAVNAATAMGCGAELGTLSALGITCVDESLCESAECVRGDVCDQGQCSVPACAPDTYDAQGNDAQERATPLNFGPLVEPSLSLCDNDSDWYVIDIPANSSLRVDVSFQHLQADVDFKAYNEAGDQLLGSTSSTDNERITFLPDTEARRVWLHVFIYGTTSSVPDPMAELKSALYGLYISTDLPAQVCNASGVCGEGEECLERGVCGPPPPCLSDADCPYSMCDIPSGRCIDCYVDDDCYEGSRCNPETFECVSCLSNADCADNTDRNVCDAERSSCVECIANTDCGADEVCADDQRCISSVCEGVVANDANSAIPVAWSGSTAEVSQTFCAQDTFYSFTANGGENLLFSLLFAHDEGNLSLSITDPQGSVELRSSYDDNEVVGYPNAIPGEYIARVYSFGARSAQYTLRAEQSAEPVCYADEQCVGGGACDIPNGLCRPAGYCAVNTDCAVDAPVCNVATNTCGGCSLDPFEPNDDIASAVSPPAPSQALNTCGGPDFFKVNASPGQTIVATINFTHEIGDVDLRLHNPQGSQVSQSAGVNDEESITYNVMEGGVYTVEVYGFLDVYNEYTISVSVD